jgi:hypothetical protein
VLSTGDRAPRCPRFSTERTRTTTVWGRRARTSPETGDLCAATVEAAEASDRQTPPPPLKRPRQIRSELADPLRPSQHTESGRRGRAGLRFGYERARYYLVLGASDLVVLKSADGAMGWTAASASLTFA